MVVGQVVRAHGVRGALRVRATGETLGTLPVGAEIHGGTTTTSGVVLRVAEPLSSGIMRFDGIDDRETAAAMAGTVLSIPADRLPAVDPADTFYVRDLIDCRVLLGEREVGRVEDVLERPANDVLQVATPDGGEHLLPFTHDAVVEVDLAGRSIRFRDDLVDEDPE